MRRRNSRLQKLALWGSLQMRAAPPWPLAPAPAPWMSELRRHISNGIDRARLEMIISMLKRIVFMMKMIMQMWEMAMFVMQMIMWIFKMIIFMIKGPEMIVLKVQMRTSLLKIIMRMIKNVT